MRRRAGVFARVTIRRRIAAERSPARLARAQMNPLCVDLDAFFTLTILWMSRDFDRVDMCAGLAIHGRLAFVRGPRRPSGERRRPVVGCLEKRPHGRIPSDTEVRNHDTISGCWILPRALLLEGVTSCSDSLLLTFCLATRRNPPAGPCWASRERCAPQAPIVAFAAEESVDES
jgi:hypothetical protein